MSFLHINFFYWKVVLDLALQGTYRQYASIKLQWKCPKLKSNSKKKKKKSFLVHLRHSHSNLEPPTGKWKQKYIFQVMHKTLSLRHTEFIIYSPTQSAPILIHAERWSTALTHNTYCSTYRTDERLELNPILHLISMPRELPSKILA